MGTSNLTNCESASSLFDPGVWLARYEQAGGGYAMTSGDKLVFLTGAVDGLSLTLAFREIVGQPARLEAVKTTIANRVSA
jgi:hypothetical protein